MAISLNSITCSSYLHPTTDASRSPLSGSRVSVGLRLQSPNSFGFANPNLNAEFHQKVHKSIQSRPSNTPKRGRVVMMPIGTPHVPIKIPGARREYWIDLWNALYRHRIIFLGDYITDDYSNILLATMLYLDTVDPAETEDTSDTSNRMYMYIKSEGGDITPSMAVYDTIQSLRSPVATYCVGYAYNMAAFILASGEKGRRQATPLSAIQLVSPSSAAYGQADDVKNESDELLRVRDYLYKELSKQSGQPLEKEGVNKLQLHKDIRERKFFMADQALEYGLIDRVVRPKPKKEITAEKEDDYDDDDSDEDDHDDGLEDLRTMVF